MLRACNANIIIHYEVDDHIHRPQCVHNTLELLTVTTQLVHNVAQYFVYVVAYSS